MNRRMNSPRRFGFPRPAILLLAGIATGATAFTTSARAEVRTLDTPRSFPPIASKSAWQERAREIREQILVSCGLWPMPDRPPVRYRVFGKVVRDGYSVEKVWFQSYPGFYVGGNLYRPVGKGGGPFPGVLNPHGHWANGRLTDTADGSIPARCISFARQGMVAFAYDMVGYNDTLFADARSGASFSDLHHRFDTNRADLLWNISLMGLQTWNSLRALDFLAALPDVNPKRLACTGASGGGTQTFMLGAVDDRLAAQAPVVMVSHSMQGGCLCENAPGLRVEYSNMEIAAAAAPRPQILVAAAGDWTKDTLTIEGPAIAGIYRLFGKPDRLRYVRFDFGHNYNRTSREAVYDWFGQWLLTHPDPALLKEQPYQKEADADSRVFPDGRLPEDAITRAQLAEALKQGHRTQWENLVPRNSTGLAKFKRLVEPAWRHTLLVDWPLRRDGRTASASSLTEDPARHVEVVELTPGNSRRLSAKWIQPVGRARSASCVVLADGEEFGEKLSQRGVAVLVLPPRSSGDLPDPFANFFTTYNRTALQLQVQELLAGCAYVKRLHPRQRVVLVGVGRAGLAALLAAPAAGGVVADCDVLDATRDDALLAPDVFCPGLRNIGTFEGAAMLATPHPLLLHHTGDHFPTDAIQAVYQAAGARGRLRIEPRELTEDELLGWISKLK